MSAVKDIEIDQLYVENSRIEMAAMEIGVGPNELTVIKLFNSNTYIELCMTTIEQRIYQLRQFNRPVMLSTIIPHNWSVMTEFDRMILRSRLKSLIQSGHIEVAEIDDIDHTSDLRMKMK